MNSFSQTRFTSFTDCPLEDLVVSKLDSRPTWKDISDDVTV